MAERRMFSKKVVDSDMFMEMPLSTQCLYFHLALRADDDGFVNKVKRIMRMIGSADDDLRILISKDFVKPFESGVVVITHWKVHNYIAKDRYKPSTLPEKQLLTYGKNGIYEFVETGAESVEPICIQSDDSVSTNCIQSVDVGKDSLNKDKLNKERINIYCPSDDERISHSTLEKEFEQCWEAYPRKQGKQKAFSAFKRSRKRGATVEEILFGIKNYVEDIKAKGTGSDFIKMGSTFFQGECWTDEYGTTIDNKPDYQKHSDVDDIDI